MLQVFTARGSSGSRAGSSAAWGLGLAGLLGIARWGHGWGHDFHGAFQLVMLAKNGGFTRENPSIPARHPLTMRWFEKLA